MSESFTVSELIPRRNMLKCLENRGRNKEIKNIFQDLRFLWRSQQKSARMCVLSTPRLSIRLSACNNSKIDERIFMKCDTGEFN
jgi:hypothetical protein